MPLVLISVTFSILFFSDSKNGISIYAILFHWNPLKNSVFYFHVHAFIHSSTHTSMLEGKSGRLISISVQHDCVWHANMVSGNTSINPSSKIVPFSWYCISNQIRLDLMEIFGIFDRLETWTKSRCDEFVWLASNRDFFELKVPYKCTISKKVATAVFNSLPVSTVVWWNHRLVKFAIICLIFFCIRNPGLCGQIFRFIYTSSENAVSTRKSNASNMRVICASFFVDFFKSRSMDKAR